MTTVGDRGLICLSDGDYAAIPLMLQANRTTINAELTADAAALTTYANPTIFRQTLGSPQSGIGANSGVQLPDGTAINFVLTSALIYKKGWWDVTGSASYQESGTVTAQSYRRLTIWAKYGSSSSDRRYIYNTIVAATNSGSADSSTTTGWFYSDGVSYMNVILGFGHGNTGSTMTVSAGAQMTIRYLGSGVPL